MTANEEIEEKNYFIGIIAIGDVGADVLSSIRCVPQLANDKRLKTIRIDTHNTQVMPSSCSGNEYFFSLDNKYFFDKSYSQYSEGGDPVQSYLNNCFNSIFLDFDILIVVSESVGRERLELAKAITYFISSSKSKLRSFEYSMTEQKPTTLPLVIPFIAKPPKDDSERSLYQNASLLAHFDAFTDLLIIVDENADDSMSNNNTLLAIKQLIANFREKGLSGLELLISNSRR